MAAELVEGALGAAQGGGTEVADRVEGLGVGHDLFSYKGLRSSGARGGCAWGIWRGPERPVLNMKRHLRKIQYIGQANSIA